MFTVYVDDSGTDPKQHLAIAAALIVPACQIVALDSQWDLFSKRHGFSNLHAAECVARNPRSQFFGWDDIMVEKVLRRARQLMKARASAAFSFAINKPLFDSAAPDEWREVGGYNHYTWALRALLQQLVRWHAKRGIKEPFEFVFDRADGRDKAEIEMLMAQFDSGSPGKFEGHYSFRNRGDVPGLQCADLIAWTSYSYARMAYLNSVMNRFAKESLTDFTGDSDSGWLKTLVYRSDGLRQAIKMDRADKQAEEARRLWYQNYISRKGRSNR
jgi:hypothetical protein